MSQKTSSVYFDPIKPEEEGKKARRVIWSSKSLELALNGIDSGRRLIANPFYDGNTHLLKADLVFERTDSEISEWKHCKEDIIYFASTYCKLMTPEGIQNIVLRDYQKEYLMHLIQHRLSIFLSCRQSGKTTTSAIFMLHYLLFNIDKMALVLGNTGVTAREILSKLKQIFIELPFFLKPGIYKWNEGEITFDNGCRCKALATTAKSGISYTCHCVLADEFAHIVPSIQRSFYNNLFPVISAAKARFIISSTQNGHNLFEELWNTAITRESEYAPFKVEWYQVPEWDSKKKTWICRDEAWKKTQIANMGGSEEEFNKQFGTSFDGSSNLLISDKIISEYYASNKNKIFTNQNPFPGLMQSENWYWDPGITEPETELRKKLLVLTIDLAEGGGNDYTVINVSEILGNNENNPILSQIGYYRSNQVTLKELAFVLLNFVCSFCDSTHIIISVEWNSYGEAFNMWIDELYETYSDLYYDWDWNNIVKYYYDESKKHFRRGIKLNAKNKFMFCQFFKTSFETKKYIVNDTYTLSEIAHFGLKNGGYCAEIGHDDIIMTLIQTEAVKNSLQFKYLCQNLNPGNTQPDSQIPYPEYYYINNSDFNLKRLK